MRPYISCIPLLIVFAFASNTAVADFEYGGSCELCAIPITDSSNVFVIVDADGFEHRYGCPGCGLSILALAGDAAGTSAKVEDYLRRTMLDADQAYYLRGSQIGFCCQPYWLAFASREEAEKFALGFGGEVLDYEAALQIAPKDHMHHHHH